VKDDNPLCRRKPHSHQIKSVWGEKDTNVDGALHLNKGKTSLKGIQIWTVRCTLRLTFSTNDTNVGGALHLSHRGDHICIKPSFCFL